tara:strand:- start:23362 stop:25161 length:1800 start_codon:yes stop_codon:yes gene_type:complete
MFRANHEDERPPSGVEDAKDKEKRKDKKQAKREREEKEDNKIRHIKVRRHHLGIDGEKPDEPVEEEEEKFKPRGSTDNPANQTMPSGAGGFLTSLAMGAKGPGAAGGQMVQMSEPMDNAWSNLLKRDMSEMTDYEIDRARFAGDNPELKNEERKRAMDRLAEYYRMNHPPAYMLEEMFGERVADTHDEVSNHDHSTYFGEPLDPNEVYQYILENAGAEAAQNYINSYKDARSEFGGEREAMARFAQGLTLDNIKDAVEFENNATKDLRNIMPDNESVFDAFPYPKGVGFIEQLAPPFTPTPQSEHNFQMKYASEPMDIAWQLLKSDTIKKKESKRSVKRRRKKEGYAKWRPSTGQFEKPKGGGDPRNITSRRSKNISRNLPLGRKTGLMRPHLSVEFSHRGLASKQPPSKDPQQYRPYLASQDARKLLGGVRTVYTPHMRHSQRSYIAGDTGGGRLTNTLQYPRVPRPRLRPVRAPSIVPPQLKRPHLARPKMPSMITMSEDIPQHSDILKANAYQAALMRIALKEIRELMREKKDKDSKKKGKGEPDTAGAASTLPNYPANSPKQTNRNEGATEDVNNEPRDFGLDPGALVGRGSGRV